MKPVFTTFALLFALAFGLSAQHRTTGLPLNCESEPTTAAFGIQVSQQEGVSYITASPLPCGVVMVKFAVSYTDEKGTTQTVAAVVPRVLYYANYALIAPVITNLKISAEALIGGGAVQYP